MKGGRGWQIGKWWDVADNGGWEDRNDIFEDSDGEAKADGAQGQIKDEKTKVFNVNEKLSVPQIFFILFELAAPPQRKAVGRRIQGFHILTEARVECRMELAGNDF